MLLQDWRPNYTNKIKMSFNGSNFEKIISYLSKMCELNNLRLALITVEKNSKRDYKDVANDHNTRLVDFVKQTFKDNGFGAVAFSPLFKWKNDYYVIAILGNSDSSSLLLFSEYDYEEITAESLKRNHRWLIEWFNEKMDSNGDQRLRLFGNIIDYAFAFYLVSGSGVNISDMSEIKGIGLGKNPVLVFSRSENGIIRGFLIDSILHKSGFMVVTTKATICILKKNVISLYNAKTGHNFIFPLACDKKLDARDQKKSDYMYFNNEHDFKKSVVVYLQKIVELYIYFLQEVIGEDGFEWYKFTPNIFIGKNSDFKYLPLKYDTIHFRVQFDKGISEEERQKKLEEIKMAIANRNESSKKESKNSRKVYEYREDSDNVINVEPKFVMENELDESDDDEENGEDIDDIDEYIEMDNRYLYMAYDYLRMSKYFLSFDDYLNEDGEVYIIGNKKFKKSEINERTITKAKNILGRAIDYKAEQGIYNDNVNGHSIIASLHDLMLKKGIEKVVHGYPFEFNVSELNNGIFGSILATKTMIKRMPETTEKGDDRYVSKVAVSLFKSKGKDVSCIWWDSTPLRIGKRDIKDGLLGLLNILRQDFNGIADDVSILSDVLLRWIDKSIYLFNDSFLLVDLSNKHILIPMLTQYTPKLFATDRILLDDGTFNPNIDFRKLVSNLSYPQFVHSRERGIVLEVEDNDPYVRLLIPIVNPPKSISKDNRLREITVLSYDDGNLKQLNGNSIVDSEGNIKLDVLSFYINSHVYDYVTLSSISKTTILEKMLDIMVGLT